jgi:DNA (cytosine-5)-methyltransferase 1
MNNVDHPAELPTVLSLCTGYGGIERGLELAGYQHRTIAHVEIEAFAAANLVAKMEEGQLVPAPVWSDLKTLPAHCFRDKVDVLTGGYPCQPFSAAGLRKGAEDPRHLWPYIYDHIRTIRPVRCFFENVEGHISLGLREVIADLESLGYATTWGIFSASEVGAPHQRKRVYILAYASGAGRQQVTRGSHEDEAAHEGRASIQGNVTAGDGEGRGARVMADANSAGQQGRLQRRSPDEEGRQEQAFRRATERGNQRPRDRQSGGPLISELGRGFDGSASWLDGSWELGVERVTNSQNHRVDRLRLLGNGVVPHTAAKAWIVLNDQLIKAMRE